MGRSWIWAHRTAVSDHSDSFTRKNMLECMGGIEKAEEVAADVDKDKDVAKVRLCFRDSLCLKCAVITGT